MANPSPAPPIGISVLASSTPSQFMRPFAIGATAYLWATNFLFMLTRGTFSSSDRWMDVYLVILGIYTWHGHKLSFSEAQICGDF